MAIFNIVGNTLVDPSDFNRLLASAAENNHSDDFRYGTAKYAPGCGEAAALPFNPIGIGKPLSVEILTVYTGDFIRGLFSGKKRDILCVSGARPLNSFNSAPRAVNIIDKVTDKSYLQFPAVKAGTPFIYYTKAADFDTLSVSVELDGRSFNEDIFKTIASLMRKAAGLPVFLPAAGFLLGGSELVKLTSFAGKEIFESHAFINETLEIRFATAGMPESVARSFLLCRDADKAELSGYKIEYVEDGGSYQMRLVKAGIQYSGNAPYIIINVDGAEKSGLESFTPTLASSDLLARFYGNENALQGAATILQEAMLLYNDLNYRLKAERIALQLKESADQPGTDDHLKKKALFNAYLKNIQNDLLKKRITL